MWTSIMPKTCLICNHNKLISSTLWFLDIMKYKNKCPQRAHSPVGKTTISLVPETDLIVLLAATDYGPRF